MLNPSKYIYKVEDSDLDNPDLKGYEVGWYFSDETESFVGPYTSQQEAIDALERYEP